MVSQVMVENRRSALMKLIEEGDQLIAEFEAIDIPITTVPVFSAYQNAKNRADYALRTIKNYQEKSKFLLDWIFYYPDLFLPLWDDIVDLEDRSTNILHYISQQIQILLIIMEKKYRKLH